MKMGLCLALVGSFVVSMVGCESGLESQLVSAEAELSSVQAELRDLEGQLSDTEGQLSDTEGQLSDSIELLEDAIEALELCASTGLSALKIVNNFAHQPIWYVYISPKESTGWGNDRLGKNIIKEGGGWFYFILEPGDYDVRIIWGSNVHEKVEDFTLVRGAVETITYN